MFTTAVMKLKKITETHSLINFISLEQVIPKLYLENITLKCLEMQTLLTAFEGHVCPAMQKVVTYHPSTPAPRIR